MQGKCVFLNDPVLEKGIGDVDGEVCERIWSYMGRFSAITKEMSSVTRMNLLEDVLHNTWLRSFNKLKEMKKKAAKLLIRIDEARAGLTNSKIHCKRFMYVS